MLFLPKNPAGAKGYQKQKTKMSRPIEPTPILFGKDALKLVREIEETNKLMKDPEYRERNLAHLNNCKKLYKKFMCTGAID